jgi:hypothetical protein
MTQPFRRTVLGALGGAVASSLAAAARFPLHPNAPCQPKPQSAGEPTAVIVPIELWREIASERETAYLLRSETMRQRLLAAKHRNEGLSLEAAIEKLRI